MSYLHFIHILISEMSDYSDSPSSTSISSSSPSISTVTMLNSLETTSDETFVQNNNVVESERAFSFGKVASNYDKYRPSFPENAATLLGDFNHLDVVEIGAGTGLATRYLLKTYKEMKSLTVIEPDLDMLNILKGSLRTNVRNNDLDIDYSVNDKEKREYDKNNLEDIRLDSFSTSFKALANQSEDMDLPDNSADVVIMVSTWHWLDKERTTMEISRILRPGGKLMILWNSFYGEKYPWLKQMVRVRDNPDLLLLEDSTTLASNLSYSGSGLRHRVHHEAYFDPKWDAPLTNVQQVNLEYKWERTIQEVIFLFRTYSGSITKSTEETRQKMDQFIREILLEHAERCPSKDDKIELQKNAVNEIDNVSIFFPMNLRGTIALRK